MCDMSHDACHDMYIRDWQSTYLPFFVYNSCRILDLTTPLYLGGIEPSILSGNPPLSSASYDGCLSDVTVGLAVVDLGAPVRQEGTQPGCPPLERSCDQSCPNAGEECVSVWNGTLCTCDSSTQCQSESICAVFVTHTHREHHLLLPVQHDEWKFLLYYHVHMHKVGSIGM